MITKQKVWLVMPLVLLGCGAGDVTRLIEPSVIVASDGRDVAADRCWAKDTAEEIWFERPCDSAVTPEFIETLQRALKARDHYSAEITGKMDQPTRIAVLAYQQPQGIDSDVLSLSAARQLGLIEVEIDGETG